MRYNANGPEEANAADWGAKDDMRVINGDNGIRAVWAEEEKIRPACFDHENPGCRRIFMTWDSPDIQGFMADHPTAELMSAAAAIVTPQLPGCENGCDIQQMMKNWAAQHGMPVPEWTSSLFNSVYWMRHPDICGSKLTIYGIPSNEADDTETYLNNHQPKFAGHSYLSEHAYFRNVTGTPGWETVFIEKM